MNRPTPNAKRNVLNRAYSPKSLRHASKLKHHRRENRRLTACVPSRRIVSAFA